ncbi:acyl-homoserine-lactone synthase [Sphingomonas sp. UNC305MFCol5.2]|uniref:acyl-homoserine-lactone synthase n=1 Tax=Sphingomonas sp. UNC305MFCol5.2 TaxID=1449076 RepID=UPI000565A0C2|nr:acyl-homoserine-lactone synthase [Sphingomonas sp. UNC305MFCol5.2]
MHLLIGPGDSAGEAQAFRAMFAARKRVFIDLLQWDVPVLAGQYEIDQFDDPHATYLILTDTAGAHLASARLLETERPHILDSMFPELCAGPIPRGPRIREITRFCLDRDLSAAERRRVRDTLVAALADYALLTGIDSYTGVAERGWLEQILGFGWRCALLGEPDRAGLGALQMFIDSETPALLRASGLLPMTTLADAGRRNAA